MQGRRMWRRREFRRRCRILGKYSSFMSLVSVLYYFVCFTSSPTESHMTVLLWLLLLLCLSWMLALHCLPGCPMTRAVSRLSLPLLSPITSLFTSSGCSFNLTGTPSFSYLFPYSHIATGTSTLSLFFRLTYVFRDTLQ